VVRNGRIIDVCREPGEHLFESGDAPSLFAGGTAGSFVRTVGRGFTYGGDPPPVTHRVYYINTKEITGNLFETEVPIPFRVRADFASIDIDCDLYAAGAYSFRIVDPEKAYKRLTMSSGRWDSRALLGQMKAEMASILQVSAGRFSGIGIYPSSLPEKVPQLESLIREEFNRREEESRGIRLLGIAFSELRLTRADGEMITRLEKAVLWRSPELGRLFYPPGEAPEPETPRVPGVVRPDGSWICGCGKENGSRFCRECGKGRPTDWFCRCGKRNTANFCVECGKPRPF